jgi:uncharacterized radical SAM superfamily Fe-S cluster-containing enzyme
LATEHRELAAPAIGLEALVERYTPTGTRFRPEDSPFGTLFADVTQRCNMACRNCYIPVHDLPDLPIDWLYDVLARLPRRTRIRLVGAEPTMREDLPEIIARARARALADNPLETASSSGAPATSHASRRRA